MKIILKILKWFLLLPPAFFPLYSFLPKAPPPPQEPPFSIQTFLPPLIWLGLIFLCPLVVFFTRSRWTAEELSSAILVVKLLQGILIPISVFIIVHRPVLYYLLFLPTCMIGLAAVLRCREEGILSTKKAVVLGLLQFAVVADLASAVFLWFKVIARHKGEN